MEDLGNSNMVPGYYSVLSGISLLLIQLSKEKEGINV